MVHSQPVAVFITQNCEQYTVTFVLGGKPLCSDFFTWLFKQWTGMTKYENDYTKTTVTHCTQSCNYIVLK